MGERAAIEVYTTVVVVLQSEMSTRGLPKLVPTPTCPIHYAP
jgi:hypothetical protein